MKKLAVIGASYLQEPLIQKARSMGLETHVFAWAANDVGEKSADHFYPISIVEKEAILDQCREIGIDGICTIASDLAVITVNYVADALGLTANSPGCTLVSTNKHLMRERFAGHGDPSPASLLVSSADDLRGIRLNYPVIVKPLDRSGSRGITKLKGPEGLAEAVSLAESQGFIKQALVEEFAIGREYSVECVSWQGEHHLLAITQKFTTGAPHFVETAHLEPAAFSAAETERIRKIIFHALDSLEIRYGASHSEFKMDASGLIRLIEIGGRMGGDCIGSSLVELSSGVDFLRAVIDTALGTPPDLTPVHPGRAAAVRFVFTGEDLDVLEQCRNEHPEYLVTADVRTPGQQEVTDSSARYGYFLMTADSRGDLLRYLPAQREEEF